MSSIRYRPSSLLRAVRTAIDANYAAAATAINADLGVEGAPYTIPVSVDVRIGAQGGELPEHLPASTSPLVKLVFLPAQVRADGSNRLGRRSFRVEISAFLAYDQILGLGGSGVPMLSADAEEEEVTIQAALDVREAVRRAITAALSSIYGAGSDTGLVFDESHQIQDFLPDSGVIPAVRAVLTISGGQRILYL